MQQGFLQKMFDQTRQLLNLNRRTTSRHLFNHQNLTDSNLLKKLEADLEKKNTIIVLYFDINKFHEVEQLNDTSTAIRILAKFKNALETEILQIFWNTRLLALENLWGDDFIVLLSAERSPHLKALQDIAVACRIAVRERLKNDMLRMTGKPLDVHVGYSLLQYKPENIKVQLYRAVKDAQELAKGTIDLQTAHLLLEFKTILDNMSITPLFQPIFSLKNGEILGWEALSRGPEDNYFYSPNVLFSFAEEVGLLFPLEKICRQISMEKIGELGSEQKLFLNIHPNTISDPQFARGETLKLLQNQNLNPQNIVFEITERHSIHDFTFLNRTMDHYRGQGFMVAIDDAGSGFSSLQSIAELRPDYIKIDISLLKNINTDAVKQALLETLVIFAEKIGSFIIAEGIETQEELNTIVNMGVHFGQGFLLGRPAYPKVAPSEETISKLIRPANDRNRVLKNAFPIREITENAFFVNRNISVREVYRIMDRKDFFPGIVVVDEGKPVGLVMRNHLHRQLGSQFGVSLYFNKPISVLMDHQPLTIEEDTPIEQASRLAMNRKKGKLYDSIIVVNKEKLLIGVVSVQSILDTITRLRVEIARGANPLTGLPGSIAIEQELYRRKNEGTPFSFIYIDLDNFKAYNDRYGFERGNGIILFTANLLNSVLRKYGLGDDFLGHIGGDDFVLVTGRTNPEGLCCAIIRYFDRLIKSFYDPEDRIAGGIYSIGRYSGQNGKSENYEKKWFHFVSISMALIEYDERANPDMKTISKKAAQLKHYAKTIAGSVYVRDRRGNG